MITASPPPPAIEQPAPYQVSYGVITGTAARGSKRLIVRVGSRTLADRPLRQRRFHVRVSLPAADTAVRVVTVDRAGRRSRATVPHVFGVPPTAAPGIRTGREDKRLARELDRLARGFGPTSGIYVQNLVTGAGAAWNARATFPAASTLKLAIAVTALARAEGPPPGVGSTLDRLLRTMLIRSDDAAANETERYFGGSELGGSALVNSMMRSIGLVDSEMYGGYLDRVRRLPPLGHLPLRYRSRSKASRAWGRGKKTTAYDLARLLRAVWLASGGRGPLRAAQPGFTPADARYLLYLLAHVEDAGKIDRRIGGLPGVRVLHKAGWINDARHDNGIVLWSGGAVLVTVMTHRFAGAGSSSDVLAGEVAAAALRHFRGG